MRKITYSYTNLSRKDIFTTMPERVVYHNVSSTLLNPRKFRCYWTSMVTKSTDMYQYLFSSNSRNKTLKDKPVLSCSKKSMHSCRSIYFVLETDAATYYTHPLMRPTKKTDIYTFFPSFCYFDHPLQRVVVSMACCSL